MINNAQFFQVRDILINIWDPIGVGSIEGCEDEYDAYIGYLLMLLNKGADRQKIHDYLYEVETNSIGMNKVNLDRLEKALDALLHLNSF